MAIATTKTRCRHKARRAATRLVPVLMLLTVAACAGAPSASIAAGPEIVPHMLGPDDDDKPTAGWKLEQINRTIYDLNDQLDQAILSHIIELWRFVVPPLLRTGIGNAVDNVIEPLSVFNQLLQGNFAGAMSGTERFAVNTTIGLGGLIDVAEMSGAISGREDFGQTLGVWGVPNGPFLVLPLIGPSTLRQTVGGAVDLLTFGYITPLNLARLPNYAHWSVPAMRGVVTRDRLHEIIADARAMSKYQIDPYIIMQRLYLDSIDKKLNNDKQPVKPAEYGDLPDFDDEYDDLPDFDEYGDEYDDLPDFDEYDDPPGSDTEVRRR